MSQLHLLFTKDGLQYKILKRNHLLEEAMYINDNEDTIYSHLTNILNKDFNSISVVSAINHFTITPDGFSHHEMGFDLIRFNSPINEKTEELMLSINKKFKIQFYYSFPKKYYTLIKGKDKRTQFNFSGENFLQNIHCKNRKEIHINLYHQQCEFVALDHKNLILYNNLDIYSEVDFLYFIMFSLTKFNFNLDETHFFIYGEIIENETFVSELKKFVKNIKIIK